MKYLSVACGNLGILEKATKADNILVFSKELFGKFRGIALSQLFRPENA
jgi:hypothetical protein